MTIRCLIDRSSIAITKGIFLIALTLCAPSTATATPTPDAAARRAQLDRFVGIHPSFAVQLESAAGMPREAYEKGETVWVSIGPGQEAGGDRDRGPDQIVGLLLDAHGELISLSPLTNQEPATPGATRRGTFRMIRSEHWAGGLPLGRADLYVFLTEGESKIATAIRDASTDSSGIVSAEQAKELLARLERDSADSSGQLRAAHAEVFFIQPNAPVKSRGLSLAKAAGPSIVRAEEIVRILSPSTRGVRRSKIDLYILFGFDSSALDSGARAQLDEVAEAIGSSQLADYRFEIRGHTDIHGKEEYNRSLSLQRAESVEGYLVGDGGVAAVRLRPRGYGYRNLLDPRDIPESHAVNRRVEFVLIRP